MPLAVLQIPFAYNFGQSWKNAQFVNWLTHIKWGCARCSSKCILMRCTLHTRLERGHVFFWLHSSSLVIIWCASYVLQAMFFVVVDFTFSQTWRFQRRTPSFDSINSMGKCFCNRKYTEWQKLQIVGAFIILYLHKSFSNAANVFLLFFIDNFRTASNPAKSFVNLCK